MNIIGRQCLRNLQLDIRNPNLLYNLGRAYSFKSSISLDKLYPESKQKLYTPSFSPDPNAKFDGFIPLNKIKISYSCSSGPGGQNVNRVNTKVDVRFQINDANWLSEEIKTKLAEQYTNKINKEGYLIVKSDLTRSQHINLADALEKLRTMIRSTVVTPREVSPETEERKRKNMMKAARERLHEKRMRSQFRQNRQAAFDL